MKKLTLKNESVIGGSVNLTLENDLLTVSHANEILVQGFIDSYLDFESIMFNNDICHVLPLLEKTYQKLTGNKPSRA